MWGLGQISITGHSLQIFATVTDTYKVDCFLVCLIIELEEPTAGEDSEFAIV